MPTEPLFEPLDSATRGRLRKNLKLWYAKRARSLPWRETGEAYPIWISEIMLQQTTVTAVVPYFEKFLARFPTIHDLAHAEQDDVLRHWEGLGYYSRARNIHRTAKQLVETADGEFPRTVEELMKLPGIGRYTAGAVLSFAFDIPAPIVEANTLRLFSRMLGYEDDPRAARGQKTLWAFAEHLLPRKNVGPFNQSIMELGSLVCTPSEPDCPSCPVRSSCLAFATGKQEEIPRKATRPAITQVIEVSVAVCHDGRFLLRQNPEGVRWAGLWDFVRFPLGERESLVPEAGFASGKPLARRFTAHVEQRVEEQTKLRVQIERFLAEQKHSVTRYQIRLQCLFASVDDPASLAESETLRWVGPADFEVYPLSTTGRKLAKLLQRDAQQLRLLK
jgi:A/G-specific adenine glycosylase